MKLNRLVFVIICFSIITTLLIGPTNALEENEATASVFWLTEPINQGSIETVTIFFVNNSPQELQIYLVGLHFDWMETDQFVGNNLSDNPVVIPSYDSYTFNSIGVDIPADASLGSHSYYIGIDGLEDGEDFSWNSQTFDLIVQSSSEITYNNLETTTANKIDEAVAKNYQSSEAQSLLGQALNSYSQAIASANSNNLDYAITLLQSASNYLEQAELKEQEYIEKSGSIDPLVILIGIGVIVIVVLLIIIFVRQKRTKTVSKEQKSNETSNFNL
ncbi:MAG: hypothetical protein P8Y18_08100 [Candidatus Bathyarchaeota archaeon]